MIQRGLPLFYDITKDIKKGIKQRLIPYHIQTGLKVDYQPLTAPPLKISNAA